MENVIRQGRYLFAVAMAALGILSLVYSDFVFGLEPVPAGIPVRAFLVYLSSAVLIGGAAGSPQSGSHMVGSVVGRDARASGSWCSTFPPWCPTSATRTRGPSRLRRSPCAELPGSWWERWPPSAAMLARC